MSERDGRGPGSGEALDTMLRATMKRELRRSMLALRRAVPASALALRSAKLAERVQALDAWKSARTVAAYVAMRGEADPAPLVRDALARGARVALPRVDAARGELVWAEHREEVALARGALGIAEPPSDAEVLAPDAIDLVLVPAVALDENGHRIGMGKGFYDRALPPMSIAIRVGIVFDFQLVAEVPTEEHDAPLDWVVTDARAFAVLRAR